MRRLQSLIYLDLGFCDQIETLEPLANLRKLEALNLASCKPMDLSPLRGVGPLRVLYASMGNEDLRMVVEHHPGLVQLCCLQASEHGRLIGPELTEFSPIARLSKLRSFQTDQMTDLTPLESIESLTHLYVSGSPIKSAGPLAKLKGLRFVNLGECVDVDSYDALNDLPCLRGLWVRLSRSGVPKPQRFVRLINRGTYIAAGLDGKWHAELKRLRSKSPLPTTQAR